MVAADLLGRGNLFGNHQCKRPVRRKVSQSEGYESLLKTMRSNPVFEPGCKASFKELEMYRFCVHLAAMRYGRGILPLTNQVAEV
jgi:hypothetical protein